MYAMHLVDTTQTIGNQNYTSIQVLANGQYTVDGMRYLTWNLNFSTKMEDLLFTSRLWNLLMSLTGATAASLSYLLTRIEPNVALRCQKSFLFSFIVILRERK